MAELICDCGKHIPDHELLSDGSRRFKCKNCSKIHTLITGEENKDDISIKDGISMSIGD
jgi:hypothetical protein